MTLNELLPLFPSANENIEVFPSTSENIEVQINRGKCEPRHPGSQSMLRTQTHSCFTTDSNTQEPPNIEDRILFFTFLFASYCCCDKSLQTPDFKQCKFTLWQFCRSESQHHQELHSSQNPGDMVCPLAPLATPSFFIKPFWICWLHQVI